MQWSGDDSCQVKERVSGGQKDLKDWNSRPVYVVLQV